MGLGRRAGLGGRGGGSGGVLAPWTPNDVASANRRFWGRGDTMAGTTTVTDWNDVWGGTSFADSGSPARNTADANYTGGISAGFVEASSQFFTGPGAAALYKPLHDGTGATLGGTMLCTDAADETQVVCATQNASAASIGLIVRYRGASQGFVLVDGNGVSLDSIVIDGVAAPNVVHTWAYQRLGAAYQFYVDGALVRSGSWPNTSTADPLGVLRVGVRSVSASEFFEGTMSELTWFTEVRAAELAAYLETRVV